MVDVRCVSVDQVKRRLLHHDDMVGRQLDADALVALFSAEARSCSALARPG